MLFDLAKELLGHAEYVDALALVQRSLDLTLVRNPAQSLSEAEHYNLMAKIHKKAAQYNDALTAYRRAREIATIQLSAGVVS